ncbi:MAG: tRNA uridine-5-carboxymethylaminomethyl(34) synthesis enzyme MnmG [Planctomycetota bacterium]|nr:MAG: tRNA uridine-5-carboxymethylaminomethyl(34) synthesis enzyme MnmG [Planctomycetota bacterium]
METEQSFDVLVVGGGHGGLEAAAAAARMGAQVAMVTLEPEAIGRMSCNPAIGGLGKGQLTREIDALGGWMALLADEAGIQFRMLNTSKGRAVQSPRAQCHRLMYERAAQARVEAQKGLQVVAGEAVDFLWRKPKPSDPESSHRVGRRLAGLLLADGRRLHAEAVILTTGTFLEGVLHTGDRQRPGGRHGERGAAPLGRALRALDLATGRLKTGTPPRIAADSVDYDALQEQPGDRNPVPFSFLNRELQRPQISCWLTRTSPETHRIVRQNLHLAPMYAGRIEGVGPRYCPSLEDKVVRFADRSGHTVFLEPEGHDSDLLYANGISTSLPEEVQEEFVRTIPGMERARLRQPGYAVEYTFVRPRSLRRSLEAKAWPGLYLAGQICGTSGYEEAAGQGLLAGTNAALALQGKEPLVLGRHQAYLGVLVDDLVVSDPQEPYRMFTSRAEYRLLLRHDNADARLTPLGRELGLVGAQRWQRWQEKSQALEQAKNRLSAMRDPSSPASGGKQRTLLDLLRQPQQGWKRLLQVLPDGANWGLDREDWATLEADLQYEGYIRRQEEQVLRSRDREQSPLPEDFDFQKIAGLRNEAREALEQFQPESLGAAGRLAGVSPADLALVEIALRRWEQRQEPSQGPQVLS